jgi:hypothetical protein
MEPKANEQDMLQMPCLQLPTTSREDHKSVAGAGVAHLPAVSSPEFQAASIHVGPAEFGSPAGANRKNEPHLRG